MRRGQITAFIIVGIMVLFSVGFAIYIVNITREQSVGITVQPGESGLQGCVKSVAAAALEAVGTEGGTPASMIPLNGQEMHIGIKTGGPAGEVALEPLCLDLGPNAPTVLDPELTCLSATYQSGQPATTVIQNYLQRLIKQKIQEGCGLQSNVSVIYGGADVTVITDNVSVKLPVRFKRVFNLAYVIALRDSLDPSFDKRNLNSLGGCDGPMLECFFQGMQVTTVTTTGPYSIVKVADTDPNHELNNMPYVFEFAVDDRPPVFINPVTTVSYTPGDTITLSVADPDEDPISISCLPGPVSADCDETDTVDGIGQHTIVLTGGSGPLQVQATAKGNPSTITITATQN